LTDFHATIKLHKCLPIIHFSTLNSRSKEHFDQKVPDMLRKFIFSKRSVNPKGLNKLVRLHTIMQRKKASYYLNGEKDIPLSDIPTAQAPQFTS
jgi:hypothetical protein